MTSLRRSLVRHHAALLGVLALVAQVLFPHVHGRHGHVGWALGAGRVAHATVAVGAATNVDHTGDHASSGGCPLCRAQSDARSLLGPSALVLPHVAAEAPAFFRDAVSPLIAVEQSLAAPRAPPVHS